MIRVSTGLACLGLTAAIVTGPLMAQTTPPPAAAAPISLERGSASAAGPKSDHEFQLSVREIDATQRQLVEIAERRATPKVGAFAKQVRLAFSGGKASLRGMSNDSGVPIVGTAKLSPEHTALVTQLSASNADVDRLFVDDQVLVLKEALDLVQAYADGGTDAGWRQAAVEAAAEDHILLGTAQGLRHP